MAFVGRWIMSNNEIFTPEYIKNASDTKSVGSKETSASDLQIELDKYSTSKPRRVVIRARIINDKG